MNRKQKIIFFTGLGVTVALIALVIVLMVRESSAPKEEDTVFTDMELLDSADWRVDSLQNAYDQLELTNQYQQLEADFSQYEEQQKYLKNDTLVRQYNESKKRVESLLKELKEEKRSNTQNREKIKELQAEIATLKDIVRHYLEEIKRLGQENEGLRQEIQQVSARNQELTSQVESATASNAQLTQTVQRARKLNITGLSLAAYKNNKSEKNITKATQLGVSFTVAPNNTASAGMKTFYVRVLSPDGSLIGGHGSCQYQGASVPVSASTTKEYSNEELRVSIYVPFNVTPTAGSYTVDVFCDGERLSSGHFNMGKK